MAPGFGLRGQWQRESDRTDTRQTEPSCPLLLISHAHYKKNPSGTYALVFEGSLWWSEILSRMETEEI